MNMLRFGAMSGADIPTATATMNTSGQLLLGGTTTPTHTLNVVGDITVSDTLFANGFLKAAQSAIVTDTLKVGRDIQLYQDGDILFQHTGWIHFADTLGVSRLFLRPSASTNPMQFTPIASGADINFDNNALTQNIFSIKDIGVITVSGTALATLPAAPDGSLKYCTDCTRNTRPCTGSGGGAMAFRNGGQWDCP